MLFYPIIYFEFMKVFLSESINDYTTYTFNYAAYCIKESQDELPQIYAKGFLPYSNNIEILPEVYYLCRSLRVDTNRFQDSSENRRVDRKLTELDIQVRAIAKSDFDLEDAQFQNFCFKYAAERFSNNAMNASRLSYILNRPSASHLIEFTSKGKLVGYVWAVIEGTMLHYWYAFFDTQYLGVYPIGKWMMWRTIKWAKEEGLEHVYLGTCYGEKSLYKVRDFKGLAFFNGSIWDTDTKRLKQLCKTDQETRTSDLFKQESDPNAFLEGILND